MLGEAQWAWLEAQLSKPAELRLLVTSIQLLVGDHGYESWGLFPAERTRMFEVLGRSGAHGIVVLSGDRHRGEISCATVPGIGYPLIELTSSSLNKPLEGTEENRYRIPQTPHVDGPNYGLVGLSWDDDSTVTLALQGEGGERLLERAVPLAALQVGASVKSGLDCISVDG
jgi:alkaline phosphatase D